MEITLSKKLRVFAWLLLMDRLNTKDLMQRKNWTIDDGVHCVLCGTHVTESRDHLFFSCPYAAACWTKIRISWDPSIPLSQRIQRAKRLFTGQCFMQIFICAAWNMEG
jgi:hypothetical protein